MSKLNSHLIKNYMESHNFTQKQMAKMCDVSVFTIQKILSGKGVLMGDTLVKICKTTKIKCDDLLCHHTIK